MIKMVLTLLPSTFCIVPPHKACLSDLDLVFAQLVHKNNPCQQAQLLGQS